MPPADKSKYKLDIFATLNAIDRRDFEFLSRQPADAQKGFAPRVVMRWASAVEGRDTSAYLRRVNEMVNVDLDAIADHPGLQYRLMAAAGVGRRQNHKWLNMAKPGKAPETLQAFLWKFHPLANATEIDIILSRYTVDTFEEFVNGCGCHPDEAEDLINVFKERSGIAVKKRRKTK